MGTTVLPRQVLRAVPYAMGLIGGAEVQAGTAAETSYGLSVSNSGGRGLYLDAKGDGLLGLNNADLTYSDEGYSGPDTEVWIPAGNTVINAASLAIGHTEYASYGDVKIEADAAGNVYVELPVQIERPYGRSYQLKSATIYYSTDATSKIIHTWLLGRNLSTGATRLIAENTTDYASATYASYAVAPASPVALSTTTMLTNLQFVVNMSDANGTVTIYAVRLTLGSSY